MNTKYRPTFIKRKSFWIRLIIIILILGFIRDEKIRNMILLFIIGA